MIVFTLIPHPLKKMGSGPHSVLLLEPTRRSEALHFPRAGGTGMGRDCWHYGDNMFLLYR